MGTSVIKSAIAWRRLPGLGHGRKRTRLLLAPTRYSYKRDNSDQARRDWDADVEDPR